MKKGYSGHLETITRANQTYRTVLYTAQHMQLVVMAIAPGDAIGTETHPDNDQFFRCDAGEGMVEIDGTQHKISDGDAVIIPAGSVHNVINTGNEMLQLYTIYAPPHHKDGIVHMTHADEYEEDFDGVTTE